MNTQERLSQRLQILQDLHCQVDEVNGMIYVIYNRKLDVSLTWLKYMGKPKFTRLLEDCQEAFTKYHDK